MQVMDMPLSTDALYKVIEVLPAPLSLRLDLYELRTLEDQPQLSEYGVDLNSKAGFNSVVDARPVSSKNLLSLIEKLKEGPIKLDDGLHIQGIKSIYWQLEDNFDVNYANGKLIVASTYNHSPTQEIINPVNVIECARKIIDAIEGEELDIRVVIDGPDK